MRVIRSDVLGMCFGVRDALAMLADIERPCEVTIHGELVHNEAVLVQLGARGFPMVGEADRSTVPPTPSVLVTAHGISDTERARLERAGKHLIDTTCPLVARVHRAAKGLQEQGYHVLVIGRPGHVEVKGIVEDLHHYQVIQSVDEVERYPGDRLGVVCQTTTAPRLASAIREAIVARNPHAEVRFVDTVCRPTKEHQRALDRLIDQVEAMVVVGGRNSNNTRELVTLCKERALPVVHVQGATDLDPAWFVDFEVVGLTAGTSTLDATINEVEQALNRIASARPLAVGC
ncbi:MAG: 4-hydroxy-3-methylbut-2-enyl diphosphate reductase [Isosphaeraceae bacterium]